MKKINPLTEYQDEIEKLLSLVYTKGLLITFTEARVKKLEQMINDLQTKMVRSKDSVTVDF